MSDAAECSRLRPYLVDFVVGDLDPGKGRRQEIERHLADCGSCRAVAEELRGTGRALEAISACEAHLNDAARRELSTKAHIEAEKLRQAGDRRRAAVAAARLFRRVPLYAWIVLALGAGAAVALAALAPRLGLFAEARPAAKVLAPAGAEFGKELAPGAEVSLPADAGLRLDLADGTRLDLRGPAEARLASGEAPLEIRKGLAWLHAGSALRLKLEPLRGLELASGAQAAIEVRPTEDEAVVLAVLAGSARYRTAGGEGQVAQGQTLVVQLRSGAAAVRPSKETETAPWHRNLPVLK